MYPQREAAVVSCCFLLLYCEVDPTIKISPTSRIPVDKAVTAMKKYISNPGHVVIIIRKTKEFIDKEMISVETVRRIHDLLTKTTAEQVKTVEKTLTGFAIYELIVFSVMYYQGYAKKHYNVDILDKNFLCGDSNLKVKNKKTEDGRKSFESFEIDLQKEENKEIKKIEKPTSAIPKPKPNISPLRSSQTQKSLKLQSSSPKKGVPTKSPQKLQQESHNKNVFKPDEKSPIKKNALEIKKNSSENKKNSSENKKNSSETKKNSSETKKSPVNKASSKLILNNSRFSNSPPSSQRDVLEEMQYHKFVEEKFRHFFVDKLKIETEKLLKSGLDRQDIKIVNEMKAAKNRVE